MSQPKANQNFFTSKGNMTMNAIVNLNRAAGVSFPTLSAKTDFDAVAEPIYMANHETGRAMKIGADIGRVIRRTDSGDALGVVGQRYGIAPNRPLFDMICEAAENTLPRHALQDIELKEFASHGGQYTRFELCFPGLGADIRQLSGASTQLKFRVGVANSFNGSGSVRLMAGAYDLVCTNGMVVGECERKAARHTSGYTPAKFSEFIEIEFSKYLERVRVWQSWARAEINPAQAAETLEAAGMSGRRVKAMMEQFQTEAASRGQTIWALYSALTFYSSHNSERFGVRNSSNVDNVAITLDTREREVSRVIDSNAWRDLVRVAA
jgi:hypothetical protein